MGGKSGGSPPPAPDPVQLAQAQGEANKEAIQESARVNSVDIFGPSGSTRYVKDANGLPTAQVTELTPELQALFDQQNQITGGLLDSAYGRLETAIPGQFSTDGMPYDPTQYDTGAIQAFQPSNLPYDPRGYGDVDQYVNGVQDAVFDQQMRNLRPEFDQSYERQMQNLQDRGLPVGGEAWNRAVETFGRNEANAYQQAANQAIAAGGQEANRRLGMEQGLRSTAWGEDVGTHQQQQSDWMAKLQTEQNLRNQAIQDELLGRTQNVNEISAILQGSPAMSMPQAPNIPTYQMQSPDVIGAHLGAYNAQMQGYNAQQAAAGSAWQGAGQLAGGAAALAMKSSITYKHDEAPAKDILERVRSMPVHTWRYRREIDPHQEIHIGPYAEDWLETLGLGNGKQIAVVDAVGVCLKCIQELTDELARTRNRVTELEAKQ